MTNLPFLRWLVSHPAVTAGGVSTAFLVENPPLSRPAPTPDGPWNGRWRLNLPRPAVIGRPSLTPAPTDDAVGDPLVTSPMPGTIVRVLVEEGDRVEARQTLVLLEAMKLETAVVAPFAGVVATVAVAEGDVVRPGETLIRLRA